MGHDPQSGEAGARAVTAIWPHEDTLVEFEVGDATVTTTEDHEFWNVTDQAWQETQHIDAGDLLLTADGATVEAGTLLWETAHVAPAFDLTIDGIHTYHVTAGDESVLVHNQSCGETDFPADSPLRQREVETAETFVNSGDFPGTLSDYESLFGNARFDFIDLENGVVYDAIGNLPEGLDWATQSNRDNNFINSLADHIDDANSLPEVPDSVTDGFVLLDVRGIPEVGRADISQFLVDNPTDRVIIVE